MLSIQHLLSRWLIIIPKVINGVDRKIINQVFQGGGSRDGIVVMSQYQRVRGVGNRVNMGDPMS